MPGLYEESWIHHPQARVDAELDLDATESAHLARVLRLEAGTRCLVTDGRGSLFLSELEEISPRRCRLRCLEKQLESPAPRFSLGQAILKNRGLEEVVELCTQVPLRSIRPLWTDHVQVPRSRDIEHQLERLRAKAVAGLQQSKQTWLCLIEPPSTLDQWLSQTPGQKVGILDATGNSPATEALDTLVVGPEGGFSTRELAFFEQSGHARLSLGTSRLRAITAGFWALGKFS